MPSPPRRTLELAASLRVQTWPLKYLFPRETSRGGACNKGYNLEVLDGSFSADDGDNTVAERALQRARELVESDSTSGERSASSDVRLAGYIEAQHVGDLSVLALFLLNPPNPLSNASRPGSRPHKTPARAVCNDPPSTRERMEEDGGGDSHSRSRREIRWASLIFAVEPAS
jgi:hypothetical protein